MKIHINLLQYEYKKLGPSLYDTLVDEMMSTELSVCLSLLNVNKLALTCHIDAGAGYCVDPIC